MTFDIEHLRSWVVRTEAGRPGDPCTLCALTDGQPHGGFFHPSRQCAACALAARSTRANGLKNRNIKKQRFNEMMTTTKRSVMRCAWDSKQFPDEYFRRIETQKAYPRPCRCADGGRLAGCDDSRGVCGGIRSLVSCTPRVIMEEITAVEAMLAAVHGQMYSMSTLPRNGSKAKVKIPPASPLVRTAHPVMAVTELHHGNRHHQASLHLTAGKQRTLCRTPDIGSPVCSIPI
jgi:hypothetical protein